MSYQLIPAQTWSSLTTLLFIYGAYCLWVVLQSLWSRISGVRWPDVIPYLVSSLLILAHLAGQLSAITVGGAILLWTALRTAYDLGRMATPSEREYVLLRLAAPLLLASEMTSDSAFGPWHSSWTLTTGLKIVAFFLYGRFASGGTDIWSVESPKNWISGIALSVGLMSAVFSLVQGIQGNDVARTMAGVLLLVAGVVAFQAPTAFHPADRAQRRDNRQLNRDTFRPENGH